MRLKRLISAFIACAMLVTFMPMQAFAVNDAVEEQIETVQLNEELVESDGLDSAAPDTLKTHTEDKGDESIVLGESKGLSGTYDGVIYHEWDSSDPQSVSVRAKGIFGFKAEITAKRMSTNPVTITHKYRATIWNDWNSESWEVTVTPPAAKFFVLKAAGNEPESGEDQGQDNYYPNARDTIEVDDITYDEATGLPGFLTETGYELLQDNDGEYFALGGETPIDDKLVIEPGQKFMKALRDVAGLSDKQKIVWYVMKDQEDGYHVDGYVSNIPVNVTYKANYPDDARALDKVEETVTGSEYSILSLEECEFTEPSGYKFVGWKLEDSDTDTDKIYEPDDVFALRKAETFIAQWEEDKEPVESTNGYFYVLKPGEQNPGTTDPQHFYYVGQGNIQEVPEEEITFEEDGVADQIVKVPSTWPEGADEIKSAVGTNFENVFWYRVSQAAGANSNGATSVVPDKTTTWHVDGILKPRNPNYQVRFILRQEETEPVLNVYDIPSGTPISNQNIQSAANKALQIGNPGKGYVVRWKDANGQVVTDEQIIAATKRAQPKAVLVFYAEFVQPAMPTVQEALADYKKTVTAPESVETFQLTAFKFKLEKQNTNGNWNVVTNNLSTVLVSQPVEDLMIAGTNDYLQPGTYRLTEVQTEEELKHWAKNNQQFTFTVTNDGKIVRTSEETVFENTYLVPKLSVEKQLSKVNNQPYTPGDMVSVGDTLTYTVAVENTGNVDLNNVTVTDTFTGSGAPTTSTEGVTWEQEPDGSSYNATWSIGALNQGIKAMMTYTYTVTDADKGKTIANTAVADSDEITENKPQDMISVNVATDKQITVNYYSNNTDYGTVSAEAANKVFTFTEGEIATAKANGDKLPVRKLHAQATETSDGDFDRWTSSDFGTLFPVRSATLDVEVTFTVDQLGETLEVVANFDRETGGGGAHHPDARDDDDDDNDRDDEDDTEESIDEEVPLAETPWLNTEDHYAYIIGYSEDGTVRPNANISRAEVATIFFRLLTDEARDQFWMTTNNFSDVLPNDWYNNAVSTMVNMGIIQGYEDGTFRPNANITRAEFAAIAARFMSSGYDVEEDLFTDIANHWARESINDAAMAGWINGYEDGTFRPDAAITRAEAVTLVNNVLQRKPDADHMFDSMIKWPDNPEGTWYYEAIQEATNSHDYDLFEDAEYETWTALQENRDWAALEKDWVNTHRTGGEVA